MFNQSPWKARFEDMLSLKKYLTSADERHALLRVMSLILDGVATHTNSFDPVEHRSFQETLRRLQDELMEAQGPDRGMTFIAGAIVQTLEVYNRDVRRQYHGHARELRDMVELVTEALRHTCNVNQRTVYSLGEIEKELRHATQIDDLRTVRGKLEECLASVKSEVARQIADSSAANAALGAVSPKPPPSTGSTQTGGNASTGLPGREESRTCLEKARNAHSPMWAVALSLDRLATVRSRFGAKAADTYLLMASQSVAQKMSDRDQLFQWAGQGFLAVIERSGTVEAVRSEIAQLSSTQRPFTFTVGERRILIPLSISFSCLPAWMAPDADTLIEKIDEFVLRATP